MMSNNKLLLLIISLAIVLRFYHLGSADLGFFRDEAALGFNSWSILKTGADEFGQKYPIIFRSFEVFFMPAYVYLSVPIFAIFGPNEFSAIFLSALSGVALTYLAYLLTKKITNNPVIGLISALIVATSPWAIFYSRGAFEGNLSLLFFAFGVYLWLKFKQSNLNKWFLLSIIAFVLSMYSYQAPRPVAPLFIAISIILEKAWWKKWKLWIVGAVLAIVLYLPVLSLTTKAAGYHRAVGVSIFSSSMPVPGYRSDSGDWQKFYLVPREILSLYLHYFSPANIFWQGDYNVQRRLPNFSVFYFWQLPFFIIGLWTILKNKFGIKHSFLQNKKYLLIWLFLGPLPAALTRDPFHTYRSILFWLPVSIIIAIGIYQALQMTTKLKKLATISYVIVTLFSVSTFMFSLLKFTPVFYWRDWDYGYKQIAGYLKTQPDNLRVVIDDARTESYINLLFYQIVPMKAYQTQAANLLPSKDYYQNPAEIRPEKVGRFEFRQVDWPSERGSTGTIFIFPAARLYPSEFSGDPKLRLDKTIFAPSGEPAFYIIRTQAILN